MLRRRVAVIEAVSEPQGTIVWSTPTNHEERSVQFPEFLSEILAMRCDAKKENTWSSHHPKVAILRGGDNSTRQ